MGRKNRTLSSCSTVIQVRLMYIVRVRTDSVSELISWHPNIFS
jgi:hypothetical protein